MFRRFLAAIVGIMVCINLLWVPPIQGAGDNSLIRVKIGIYGFTQERKCLCKR